MTTDFKRHRIEDLVDEVATDPSRAEEVKNALKRMIDVKKPRQVLSRGGRPIFECDDYFDNVPV